MVEVSATTYEFLENNLRATNDSLRNVDLIEHLFEHKKNEFSLLFRLSNIVNYIYKGLKLSLYGAPDTDREFTEEEKQELIEKLSVSIIEVREGLTELGKLVHEASKFASKNLIQYVFFMIKIHRPMKKISETFEDLELMVHALDGEDFGEDVSAEELIKMFDV